MDNEILFLAFILLIEGLILVKAKNKTWELIVGSMFILTLLMLAIGSVFLLSEDYYDTYSIAPYNLTYTEALSSVTQIVSVIGGTLVAALGLYFTVTSKQKNNQDKSE